MANDVTRRLMARVKELRETFGLSQEQFAERAGLKYKHYQAVEAGRKNNITFFTVLKLAEACGVEPWELLHFEIEPAALAESSANYVATAKLITTTAKNPVRSIKRTAAPKAAAKRAGRKAT